MALADIVRSGVALANTLTASLQVSVQHKAWTGSDAYGAPTYADAIVRNGLLEAKTRVLRRPNGEEVLQQSQLTILEPVAANGAAGRAEPIDPRDRFVLPDGTEKAALDVSGLADPSTGAPYGFEVALG
jgi:hypothetical protein